MNDYNTPSANKMAKYNTLKNFLVIREYGRNTQNLINHAKTIEDRAERQAYVEEIVKLMMSMHPHTRNIDDYRLKIWSHILQIADYELDVDIPDNLPDARKKTKPERLNYPQKTRRLRHYGTNVRIMIEKAKKMEDKEQQEAYIAIIASYMKMSYKTWNRENVNDEVIFKEFASIAKDELTIPEGTNIDSLVAPRKKKMSGNNSARKQHKSSSAKSNHKSSNNKNRNTKSKNSNNNKNRNKNTRNKKR